TSCNKWSLISFTHHHQKTSKQCGRKKAAGSPHLQSWVTNLLHISEKRGPIYDSVSDEEVESARRLHEQFTVRRHSMQRLGADVVSRNMSSRSSGVKRLHSGLARLRILLRENFSYVYSAVAVLRD